MTRPPANVLSLPLQQRAELALKAAVEKVIVEHARRGLPIFVWREGRIIEIQPDELQLESARLTSE